MKGFPEIEPLFSTRQFRRIIEILTPFIDETDDLAERAEQYSMLAAVSLAETSEKIALRIVELPDAPDNNHLFQGTAYEETKRYHQLCILNAVAAHSSHTDYYKYSYANFLAHYWADIAEAAIILRSVTLENLQVDEELWPRPLYIHQFLALLGATLVLSGIVEGESHLMKAYKQEMIDQAKWCDLGVMHLLIQHRTVLSKSCKDVLIEALSNYEKSTDEMLANLKALREHDNA